MARRRQTCRTGYDTSDLSLKFVVKYMCKIHAIYHNVFCREYEDCAKKCVSSAMKRQVVMRSEDAPRAKSDSSDKAYSIY